MFQAVLDEAVALAKELMHLDAELTVSYVMNRMADALVGDLRGAMLTFAAYQGLAAAE